MTHPLLSDAVVEGVKSGMTETTWAFIEKGRRPGGFPMDAEGNFLGWSDWLGKHLAPQILKALADAGYVVVPREPTQEMLMAAAMDDAYDFGWEAMLAAAEGA